MFRTPEDLTPGLARASLAAVAVGAMLGAATLAWAALPAGAEAIGADAIGAGVAGGAAGVVWRLFAVVGVFACLRYAGAAVAALVLARGTGATARDAGRLRSAAARTLAALGPTWLRRLAAASMGSAALLGPASGALAQTVEPEEGATVAAEVEDWAEPEVEPEVLAGNPGAKVRPPDPPTLAQLAAHHPTGALGAKTIPRPGPTELGPVQLAPPGRPPATLDSTDSPADLPGPADLPTPDDLPTAQIASPAAEAAAPDPLAAAAPEESTAPTPSSPDAAAAAEHSPAPDPGVYVVQRGDSLWRIAQAHGARGTAAIAAAWPEWYELNRDVIGADPDLIEPGQRLQVPQTARGGGQP